MYLKLSVSGSTSDYSVVSQYSGYSYNINPSISTHNGDPVVSWSGYTSSIPAAVIKRKTGSTWSIFRSFDNGSVAYPTNNNSRETGYDGSIISWCTMYNQSRYVKFYNGSYSTIKTLPSTYNGQAIQISNGYDFSNIKAITYNRSGSAPYAVLPAAYDFNYMEKVNDESLFNYGRIAVISKNNSEIVYGLGDIRLDNKSIKFEFVYDTVKINSAEKLTSIMKTESFSLKPESNLEFFNIAYVIKRNSTDLTLNDIRYDLELLNSKDEVIANIKHITFQIDDSSDTKSYYKLNCSTLAAGDYYLRANCKAIGNFEFNINDCIYEEDPSLHKNDFIEITAEGNSIPTVYALAQNYPNPFNPATKIKYQLPAYGYVTLKIYDILGKEVATLVNEVKTQGGYEATFDASSLASGVYLYRLNVNDYVDVKKMLMIK